MARLTSCLLILCRKSLRAVIAFTSIKVVTFGVVHIAGSVLCCCDSVVALASTPDYYFIIATRLGDCRDDCSIAATFAVAKPKIPVAIQKSRRRRLQY